MKYQITFGDTEIHTDSGEVARATLEAIIDEADIAKMDEEGTDLTCPECKFDAYNATGLKIHRSRKHNVKNGK